MRSNTIDKTLKHSIVYGYAMTQPFLFQIAAPAVSQDHILAEGEVITYGENSEIVRHIQYKLQKLGHYADQLDGQYGLLTEHAVKGLQSSVHVDVTGQMDQATMKQLLYEEKKADIDAVRSEMDQITYGDENENVTAVQEILFYHGYYQGDLDGIYGPLTEEAIQKAEAELYPEQDMQAEKKEKEATNETVKEPEQKNKAKAESKPEKERKENEVVTVEYTNDSSQIIQTAKQFIGTSYVWGGTSPDGFDCSGYIQYVYEESGVTIPRTVAEIWNFASPVEEPSVGDLVFFETYQAGPSHLGIYLGNGDFIHAGSSSGVEISNLNATSYWKDRYLGAKRISSS